MDYFRFLCDEFQLVNGTLQLCSDQPLRTVRTTRNIDKGETIIQIPQRYFINPQSKLIKQKSLLLKYLKECQQFFKSNQKALQSPDDRNDVKILFDSMKNKNSNLDGRFIYLIQCRFIFPLMQDSQRLSQVQLMHHHYIKLLPQSYSQHPLLFASQLYDFHPQTHKILLKSDQKIKMVIHTLKKIIENTYNLEPSFRQFLFQEGLPHLYEKYVSTITQQNIRWGYLVLQTRQFSANNLIPILDLFNHSSAKSNALWRYYSGISVCLYANQAIEKGTQILVRYNENISQSNYRQYGFVEDEGRWGASIPLKVGTVQIRIETWNNLNQQVRQQLNYLFLPTQEDQKNNKYFRSQFIPNCYKHSQESLSRILVIQQFIRICVKDKARVANLMMLKKINDKEKIIYDIICKQASRIISEFDKKCSKRQT